MLIEVSEASQAGEARRKATAFAAELQMSETKCGEVALVTTEMATNLVKHAGRGHILFRPLQESGREGLQITSVDKGPGSGEHSWELLQELKRDPITANIPVLVVTVVDSRDKALTLGAGAFHTTPIERAWLLKQLDDLVNRSATRQLLLIDDDAASRYVLKSALGRTDFRISEATGGHEGLRKVRDESPNVIILDLSMPDLSGFEVLAKLKEDLRTSSIPVIIHTSRVLDDTDRVLLKDAVAIVSKENNSREVLLESLANAFQTAGFPIEIGPVKEVHHE